MQNTPHLNVDYTETRANWNTFFSNWIRILSYPGRIILNLGFTSYGKSVSCNFLNFMLLGIAHLRHGNRLRLILHDSPFLYDHGTLGYRYFGLIKLGSSLATRAIRSLQIVVFSTGLRDIMTYRFSASHIHLMPFPCFSLTRNAVNAMTGATKNMVLHLGYIAPYKGVDIIPEIKKLCENVDFLVTGNWHKIISLTREGREYFNTLSDELSSSGVLLTGYITNTELEKLNSENRVIGILPHVLTSGSSYTASFLIERGIPLVCSDLPEFAWMRENGAGIVTVRREPEAFAREILKIFQDSGLYESLVAKNHLYSKNNQITRVVDVLTR